MEEPEMEDLELKLDPLDLLPLMFQTISERLALLAEIQKGEAQTQLINRQAAWERLQWVAVVWKMFAQVHLGGPDSPCAGDGGREGIGVIDKILDKDLKARIRRALEGGR